MSEFDQKYQGHNYSALCPNCGGYVVVDPETQCFRCEENLVPGCPHCNQPVSLGAGMCFICGEEIKHFILVKPQTKTTA